MVWLSFYGVISAFGASALAIGGWLVGTAIGTMCMASIVSVKNVTYSQDKKLVFVPGTWVPFIFIMAIFFTKYAVAVMLGSRLPIVDNVAFSGVISSIYGCLSGTFLGRTLAIWRALARATDKAALA